MFIQFAGYDVADNSRIYKFDVIDPTHEARQFTVGIESKTSRWGSLKLQDGPSICFERLRHELERETPELPSESHLRIEEQHIQEYLARQNPHKKAFGQKSEGVFDLNPRHTQVFPTAEKPISGLRT